MKSVWVGLSLVAMVLYFGVFKEAKSPQIFLNAHAIILVIGGSIAVSFLIYPFAKLMSMVDFILLGFLFKKQKNDLNPIYDLLYLAKYYTLAPSQLVHYQPKHPFIKDAKAFLLNSDLTSSHIEYLLKSNRDGYKKKYLEDAKMITAISKFPPALGLLGACTGMIEMMSGLGSAGVSGIGAAMAVALTATFWGIGIANFILLPLSDYAVQAAQEDLHLRNLIVESVMMMKNKFPYDVIVGQISGKATIEEKNMIRVKIKEIDGEFLHTEQGTSSPYEGGTENAA
jgi:chemotaxis protein MotA